SKLGAGRAAVLGEQVLLLLTGLAGAAGQGQEQDLGVRDASVITVSNGGDWAWLEMCPKGSYASGVSFKVEPSQGVMEDDMALSGIQLHCSHGGDPTGGYTAKSQSGRWGHWSEACWCPHQRHLVGFMLWVQLPQHGLLSDEVAATIARFACSDGHILEGLGCTWGQWGSWSLQCPRVVCGIQTWQDPARGLKRDDEALNELYLFCC
ncbi:VMO1 protein, partial [Pandion haliaetus]|nr:VMO1 protein [Pandion haliaetus]